METCTPWTSAESSPPGEGRFPPHPPPPVPGSQPRAGAQLAPVPPGRWSLAAGSAQKARWIFTSATSQIIPRGPFGCSRVLDNPVWLFFKKHANGSVSLSAGFCGTLWGTTGDPALEGSMRPSRWSGPGRRPCLAPCWHPSASDLGRDVPFLDPWALSPNRLPHCPEGRTAGGQTAGGQTADGS